NDGKHKINDGYAVGGNPQTSYFMSNDFNKGLAVFESFRLIDGNLFTVGLDAKQWGGRAWAEDFAGNETNVWFDNKHVTELAGYAVVQQTLFDKLSLNAGIRLENNERYGNEWVPQGGVVYRLNEQTSFKTSVSKGFRSPNINEMYSPWGPAANPDLLPEEMMNYDFSCLQSFFNHQLDFELTAFYTKGKNMIVPSAVLGGKNSNSGQFTNKGIDFAFRYQIIPSLKITGNYSFLDSDVKIQAAPKQKVFLALRWQWKNLTFSPDLQYVDHLYLPAYSDNGRSIPPSAEIAESYISYALLNCKVSYKVSDSTIWFINGENLTDAAYRMYSGYPMPGVVVLGGFEVKF
ncbi:MAG: TonB-dependent receptor, partial [Candidatus Symbiothrix sp.]|nr:TonB-dependent receptor [Candidatus Symbiothrix sp.]